MTKKKRRYLIKIGMSNKFNVFRSKYTKELKQNNPNRLRLSMSEGDRH